MMNNKRITKVLQNLDWKSNRLKTEAARSDKEINRLRKERMKVITNGDKIFCITCRESYHENKFRIWQEFEPDGSFECIVALCPLKHQTVVQGTKIDDSEGYCVMLDASQKEGFIMFPKKVTKKIKETRQKPRHLKKEDQ